MSIKELEDMHEEIKELLAVLHIKEEIATSGEYTYVDTDFLKGAEYVRREN